MVNLLSKPREIEFITKKSKQNMEFYLTAMMRGKTEEEIYTMFFFQLVSKEEMCSTQWPGRRKGMQRVIQQIRLTLQWDNPSRISMTISYQRIT